MTDGYQVYHTLEAEREDLTIAGCWAHSRRYFDEALKALPKARRNDSLAYLALKQIQAIYREEKEACRGICRKTTETSPGYHQANGRCLFCVGKRKSA